MRSARTWRFLRELAGASVPVHPVVKADAYGHGAIPVAKALIGAGADGLCVATLDEALALREGAVRPAPRAVSDPGKRRRGRRRPRTVRDGRRPLLGGAPPWLPSRTYRAICRTSRSMSKSRRGSGEAGSASPSWGPPLDRLRESGGCPPGGTLDAPAGARGRRVDGGPAGPVRPGSRDRARGRGLPSRVTSRQAPASWPGSPAVRGVSVPASSVYGLVPDELDPVSAGARAGIGLRPAMSLHARAVRVADLPTDWGISYGPIFRTERPSRIANCRSGYGDGWSRALSNRGDALVRGVRVPIVGRVAMDATMVDVTDVPGPPVDTFR